MSGLVRSNYGDRDVPRIHSWPCRCNLCVATVSAHVTLETQEAPVGASYKAVLRVPHGCDGSATTAIRIRLPAGVIGVKPMPKPGWKLDTVSGKYEKPFTLRGAKVNEGVTEIAWSGGKLADAHYEEFVFTSALAEELEGGRTVYIPVVQECEKVCTAGSKSPPAAARRATIQARSPHPG
jgi:uncharacterized protein YcnI